jgi:predicted transcriptional regulator
LTQYYRRSLQSNIHLARAVAFLQEDIADIFSLEIETVLRSLQQYLAREKNSALDPLLFSIANAVPLATPRTPRQRQSKGQHIERRRIIKDIISSKRQSTIKDILEKAPNYNEKMIQREIIAMIDDGTIIKEGQRRWSRYSLAMGV